MNEGRPNIVDLVKTGKVSRGYLGAGVYPVTQEYARQFKVPDTSGAFVQDVTPGGPADKAGLKPGDVVRKFNGQTVDDSGQLVAMVTDTNPGTTVTLDILRDGKPMTLKATLGERPANLAATAAPNRPSEGTLRGVTVQDLTPALRDRLGIPSSVSGVVISEVDPNSPAAQAGLQQGDVIQSINRHPVESVAAFNRLASQAKGETLLRVNRGGQGQFVVISPGGGDQGGDDESQ